MQIIVDADSRRLSLGPTPPVRGETIPGTLTFMKGGVPFRLPAGTAIQIGVKSWNDPSDVLLAYTTATRPEPDGAPYTFSLSLNTSEMLAKFTAGVTRYDCSIEVKWEVSAGSGTFKKTQRRKYSVDADTLRDTDANPSTMLSRNDFLVTNGTGLLVNVAAGYAANGAFVAAQASLAITNATNYIEVTAAGVASVNTTAFTAGSYPLATVVASAGAITANTDLRAWITPKPGAAGGITSITGTANEITVTGTTTPTLSLPSALTFTGKTVTGGTFVLPQVGYLAATFDYFGEWMTFISSTDAATWKRTHTTPIVTTEGTIRDPALHYVAATGTFYVAYTRNAFTGGNSWGLGSSTDGRTWTWSTISTGSLATGTPAHVWIGDWFTDSDGTDHVLLAANTTASQAAGGLYLYETHPTTPGDYSAWSTPVQITGSAITNNLGNSPTVIKVGSTYHLFYDLPSAGNNFYIARRSGLNYMRFDGGSNNVSLYGTATFLGSTSGSATISVSATGGLLALPSGTTATNMALTTPDCGTPSAIVLTNATGTVGSGLTIPLGTVTLTGSLPDARNTVSNTTTTSMANLATVGTLTGGATGAGFTVALSTSTITGTLADARLSANVPLKDAANTFTAENINSKSGAASVTAMKFSGVPFAGTGTTSFPLVYINDANATASTTLNTAGTYFGVNGDGTQDLMDLMKDGVSACKVNYLGTITLATTSAGVSFGGSVLRRGSQSAGVGIYTSANFFVDGSFFIGAGNGASVRMVQSGNGILTITEEDGSGMTRVNLGGATSSFPALQVTTGTQTITAGLADGTAGGAFVASGTLAVTGATTLTGNLTSNGALISTPQALTGAGAVNVTTLTTAVTTTAPAQALTLADGTNGQIKTIVHQALSGGGTWVLTPTTKTGYTTITSTAVGETCTLQFFTTIGWCILSLRGAIAA